MFVQLAVVVVIPTTAILMALLYAIMPKHEDNDNDDDNGNGHDESWEALYARYVVVLSTGSFMQKTLGTIAEGAMAIAVAEIYLQRSPLWLQCLRKAVSRAKRLVLSGVLAWIVTQLGFFCFVIPGILLRIRFVSLIPVIVLEDNHHTPLSALKRSWDLSSGRRGYVLRCLVLLNCLYLLADWILHWLLKEDSGHPYLDLSFQLLKTIPSTMIAPLRGILKTVLYINLLVLRHDTSEEQFKQQIDDGYLEAGTAGIEESGVSREPLLESAEDNNEEIELSFEEETLPLTRPQQPTLQSDNVE